MGKSEKIKIAWPKKEQLKMTLTRTSKNMFFFLVPEVSHDMSKAC